MKVIWKNNNLPWDHPPVAISPPNFAPPGAGISSVFYPIDNQLEIFTVGNDGRVYVMWKKNNLDWEEPAAISPPNFAPPGAGISSVFYPINNQLEVFTVGSNGRVYVMWKQNNQDWENRDEPTPISPPNFAPPNANISSTYYPINNQLEVFTVGNDGRFYVMRKVENNWWLPCPIPPEPVAPDNAPSQVVCTVRAGQLTGNSDPQGWTLLNGDTRHWGVSGTDLGANTEHNGRLYFFFGDVERDRFDDPKIYTDLVAWTDTTQVATHGGHAADGFNFVLPHDQTPIQ